MDILLLVAGVLIGIIICSVINIFEVTHGTLRIDHSNPDKDIYRFEIDDLDKLKNKSRIKLKIDHEADLSQK